MTRKEVVKRAVHFEQAPYIPLLYFKSYEKTDLLPLPVITHYGGDDSLTSEWGFKWEDFQFEFAFGQTKTPAFASWDEFPFIKRLDPSAPGRFDIAKQRMAEYPERYYIADLGLSGFTVMAFMRGFNALMEDFYLEPDKVDALADYVFGTEEALIRRIATQGFDAVELADDWGMQKSLLISPDLFRKVFKPRYQKQFALAHSLGLDVFLHSCGYIYDIIPDLIEAGLDILNPGQPSLNGIARMGSNFGGKICFACPVSYQTTGVSGSLEDIDAEIRSYIEHFASPRGGFIGLVTERTYQLGASEENQSAIIRGFETYAGEHHPFSS